VASSRPEHTLDLPARLESQQTRLIVALRRAHAAHWPASAMRRLADDLDGLLLAQGLLEAERAGQALLIRALELEVRGRAERRRAA